MQKLVRYFLMTLMTVCMFVPGLTTNAEAANIVVLPLINNVDYPDVESAYYDNVIDCLKQQNKYDLIDNDAITAIINKYVDKGQVPDKASMEKIAQEANADLIVSMELDKLALVPEATRPEDFSTMIMDGKTVSYNVADGKYNVHKFGTEESLDMGYYTRTNVPLRFWSNSIQHEMHKVLDFKGLGLQKPRIGKLANKN